MNEATISQEELNTLLAAARSDNEERRTAAAEARNEILKKLNSSENELKKQLKELRITVSQEEVDEVLNTAK